MIKTLITTATIIGTLLAPHGDQNTGLTIPAKDVFNYEFHHSINTSYKNMVGQILYSPTTLIPYSCYEVTTAYIEDYGAEVALWDWCDSKNQFVYRKSVVDIPQYIQNKEHWFRVIGDRNCTKVYFKNFRTGAWDEIQGRCGTSEMSYNGWTLFEVYYYSNCNNMVSSYAYGFEYVGDSYQPINFNQLEYTHFGSCVDAGQWHFEYQGNKWWAYGILDNYIFVPKVLK